MSVTGNPSILLIYRVVRYIHEKFCLNLRCIYMGFTYKATIKVRYSFPAVFQLVECLSLSFLFSFLFCLLLLVLVLCIGKALGVSEWTRERIMWVLASIWSPALWPWTSNLNSLFYQVKIIRSDEIISN